MERAMTGKVVLVTGAGGSIGRAIAAALGADGARVIVNDLGVGLHGEFVDGTDRSPAERVASEIRSGGGEAVANGDSVRDPAGAHRIIECALDHFGRIDGVVNNAGIVMDRLFHKMSDDEWSDVIDVHLNGSFFVSRAAARRFRDQQSGAFVHMTSTSGLIGNLGQANYAAAKMGIVGLSRSIATDMQRFNVRSNCVAPFAWSRMVGSIPVETPEEIDRVSKLKKMKPEHVAPLVVYLLGDDPMAVTGQIFAVRANEIMIFSQPRPVRSVHMSNGWTPEKIARLAIPAMRSNLVALERSPDVINWDPI